MKSLSSHLCAAIAALVIAVPLGSAAAKDDRRAERKEFRYLGVTIYPMIHKTIIVNDPAAPVQIRSARAIHIDQDQRYVLETSVSRHMRPLIPRGPLIEVEIDTNNASAVIVGAAFYDSFNEPAGGSSVFVPDLQQQPIQWESTANIAWHGFGIACVFVSAARLAGGDVWKADTRKVAVMMMAKGCSRDGEKNTLKHLSELRKKATRL